MQAIDYVIRDGAGRLVRGTVGYEGASNVLNVDTNSEVSLNLNREDIYDYRRLGSTLEITLQDGRIILVEGFFSEGIVTQSRLYLSADGELTEITFSESWGRTNYAHFDEAVTTSAEGELLFEASSGVVTETETTMAAVPLFLGGGFGTAGAAGAAVLGGAALLGGGDGSGDGDKVDNSVNAPGDTASKVDPTLTVDGTANPGSTVYVTVGDTTLETAPDEEGNWSVTFAGDDLPADGQYSTTVIVVDGDGGEEELQGPDVLVDTVPPDVAVLSGVKSLGDVIDAEWQEGGTELTGSGEPGAIITVIVEGTEQQTIVDANGLWYINIPEGVLPEGTYEMPVQISARDAAGNVTTLNDVLVVDTEGNDLSLDGTTLGIDNVINDAENDEGVTATGTATPGATVVLELAGATASAVADDAGTWVAMFEPGALPPGEYDATLIAKTSDDTGNVTSDSLPVRVDTLGLVTIETSTVEGDGTVNAIEAADGIVLTGTTQPGSTVAVDFAGQTYAAQVAGDGSWSLTVPAGDIADGEYSRDVEARATDAAGNVTTALGTIRFDTEIDVAFDATQAGDNLITAQEANSGIVLTGTTQAEASVSVTLEGVTRAATVSSNGTWTASFSSNDLPEGLKTLTMSATATDLAGNVATDAGTIALDTLGFVAIDDTPVEADNTINFVEASDGVIFTGTTQPGSTVTTTFAGTTRAATVEADGSWSAAYPAGDIPGGTYVAQLSATAISPSNNEATDVASVNVDTQVNGFSLSSGTLGGDGTLGADELSQGVTISGTTEVGGTVTVTISGVGRPAAVATDGTWTVTFPDGAIPAGEYDTTMSAVTTDPAGNQETISQTVRVDTVAGVLTISTTPVEGDDVINEVEASDGVAITGTADAGAVVNVTFGGIVKTAVTSESGGWQVYYSQTEIPEDTSRALISAYTVDAAGNRADATDTVQIDTEVAGFEFSARPIEGDDIISGAEASDGVLVLGMVEPGSSVIVSLGDTDIQAMVSSNGDWTATLPASAIESGEYLTSLTATATDAAGNVAAINDTVRVDTEVSSLDIVLLPVAEGGVLNAAGTAAGITIGGTVEAGSTVLVTFEGTSQYASVASNGSWTATFTAGDIPGGEYTADISVLATDAYGNTGITSAEFQVDNQAPGAPLVTAFSTGLTGLRGVSSLLSDDSVEIAELTDAGAVQNINYTTSENPAFGELSYRFTTPVSDGSDLVVTAKDAAGNSASTLFVLENEDDPSVNLENAGLNNFNIEAVDLQFASDADVVLTAELVRDLSEHADTVTIHGGSDDQVTMQGATKTGQVEQIGTQSYDVYTLADASGTSTIIIDKDIEVII